MDKIKTYILKSFKQSDNDIQRVYDLQNKKSFVEKIRFYSQKPEVSFFIGKQFGNVITYLINALLNFIGGKPLINAGKVLFFASGYIIDKLVNSVKSAKNYFALIVRDKKELKIIDVDNGFDVNTVADTLIMNNIEETHEMDKLEKEENDLDNSNLSTEASPRTSV